MSGGGKETRRQVQAIEKFLTAPDTPSEFGLLLTSRFRSHDARDTADLTWICEFQALRLSLIRQTMKSLAIPDKKFSTGTGDKTFRLSDVFTYNDWDRILHLKTKDEEESLENKPSVNVGQLLLLFMPYEVQVEYKDWTCPLTKDSGGDPIKCSMHKGSNGKPYEQALDKLMQIWAVVHPGDALAGTDLNDVTKGKCEAFQEISDDITQNKTMFIKANRDDDLTEGWVHCMNRIFRPMEDFFQGLMFRYRIFHCPEEASLHQIAGSRRRRDVADAHEDFYKGDVLPRLMDMLVRKDDKNDFVPDTYLYALNMISDQLKIQKQSQMAKPIGEETPKKKTSLKTKDTAKVGVATRTRASYQEPVEHNEPSAGEVKETRKAKAKAKTKANNAKKAEANAKLLRAKKLKEANAKEASVQAVVKDRPAAAAPAADAAETKKVQFASKNDPFSHPNLYSVGTETGKYKDSMQSFTDKVEHMITEEHRDYVPEGRLCHNEYCRQDGCPYNSARHPNHPPKLKPGTTEPANGDGECSFEHVQDDAARIQIRDKAHELRLEVWNSIPEAMKKDPKCGYAKKKADYDKTKKSKGG